MNRRGANLGFELGDGLAATEVETLSFRAAAEKPAASAVARKA